MSVRRLASDQPSAPFAFTADNLSWAKATIAKYPQGKQASAVIPLLWRAQEQNAGWVSRPVLEYVADMLGMAYIRVLEVATFYTMFQLSPVGTKAHVQVCGTTPCMLRGANDLIEVCRRKIHHEPHHRNADGTLSWEEVECLGACVNAPMVQVWKDTYEDLTPKQLEDLIDAWAADRKTTPGPQNGRTHSMALGGASTLTDKALYRGQRSYTRQEAPPPPPPAPATPVAAAVPAPKPKKVKAARPERIPDPPKPVLKSAPKAIDGRPELLKKAIGQADDLKLIRGVGPALEKLLNKIGVWHFDQIANWSPQELAWIDDKLDGFKGRARRDEWVRQAKKLATQGAAGRKAGKK